MAAEYRRVLATGFGLLLGSWVFGRPPSLTGSEGRGKRGISESSEAQIERTAVIIPVRNEERNIAELLAGLERAGRMGYGWPRVIVVDDSSTDKTLAKASGFDFVEVVQAPPPPRDWTGKAWACHLGAKVAGDSTYLVFIDADVRLGPRSLPLLLEAVASVGGLVSVHPHHETARPYEQLSLLIEILAWMGSGAGRGQRRASGAFGQVLATRTDKYRVVGGHESVRDSIVEDVALALRYKEHGLPVSVFEGSEEFSMRMYPGGICQLWEGWTKNFASGAAATSPLRLGATVLWVGTLLSTVLRFRRLDWSKPRSFLPDMLFYVASAIQVGHMGRKLGNYKYLTSLAFPVPLVFAALVTLWSTWKTFVVKSVTWRGRVIRLGSGRGYRRAVRGSSSLRAARAGASGAPELTRLPGISDYLLWRG